MTERALVRVADGGLIRIEIDPIEGGTKPGLAWMPVDRITAGTTSTAYTKAVVTQQVSAGRWQIITTVSDKTGQELTDAKDALVSSADLTLAEAFRWLVNYQFAQARVATPTLTKTAFLAQITAAQTAAGGTPAAQTPVTRAQMLTFLSGLLP